MHERSGPRGAGSRRAAGWRHRGRGRGPELGALVAGLGVAGLLLALALGPLVDPARAREAAVARIVRLANTEVEQAWNGLLRTDAWLADVDAVLTWSPAELGRTLARPRPAPVDVDAGPRPAAFRALLADSEARELRGDGEEALAAAREALALAPPGSRPLRAAALLRVAQLAAKFGDAPAARATWDALRDELTGAETRRGLPVLLLAALAVGPVLPPEARRAVRDEVVDRWIAGAFPLPDAGSLDAGAGRPRPLPTVWRGAVERLQELVPERRDGRLDRDVALLQLAPLLAGPAPTAASGDDARTTVRARGDDVFVARTAGDEARGGWTTRAALRARLGERLAAAGVPAPGLVLDWDGDDAELGEALGPWRELGDSGLGFRLRSRDPGALGAGAVAPLRLARAGLLVLAVLFALAGAALFTALRRDRRLQELRTRFVASVSHELRTPLASILLLAENLEQGRVPAGSAETYHRSIRREAQRLRRLVDDVLDFSRLERGEEPALQRADTALAPLVASLTDEVRDRVEHAGRTLDLRIEDVAGSALLDAEALRRAVLNLVDNALRHGGGDGVQLTARAGGRLSFVVADRGPGVPADQRERVFEPFAQLAGPTGSSGGAGLGLAIVRTIAREHGGDVAVRDREPGPGAVFELWIPLEEENRP